MWWGKRLMRWWDVNSLVVSVKLLENMSGYEWVLLGVLFLSYWKWECGCRVENENGGNFK